MTQSTSKQTIVHCCASVWFALLFGNACTAGASSAENPDTEGSADSDTPAHNDTGLPPDSPSSANIYSWDGSWSPLPEDFPLQGLEDSDPTQAGLPPGRWGWSNECDCASDEGTAVYENEFVAKGLDFERVEDGEGRLFGWRLVDTNGGETALDHRGDVFDGSDGVDIFDLDSLSSTGPGDRTPGINLGEGPDMLRYRTGQSVDMRTGAADRGALFDNDLVILGSEIVLGLDEYDISGTTVHTGPGSDLVFARNFGPAAIDLGNGDSGNTEALDDADGEDMVVLQGNMRDFRVFGGWGNDVFIWYVDEVVDDRFLGPNFFGGGAWGNALWGDPGTDRLILAVDPNTQIVHERGLHDNNPGSLLSFVYADYAPTGDAPTSADLFARYYGLAPVGPKDAHTVTMSYRSADAAVFTQDFYTTAVEELQLGIGEDAAVYRIDSTNGTLTKDESLVPFTAIPERTAFNQLFDSFGL